MTVSPDVPLFPRYEYDALALIGGILAGWAKYERTLDAIIRQIETNTVPASEWPPERIDLETLKYLKDSKKARSAIGNIA